MPERRPWLDPRGNAPFRSSAAGCGHYVCRPYLHPVPCKQKPVWAGLVYAPYPEPGVASWAFTCDEHRPHLTAPRRLTSWDRGEIERRAAHRDAGLAGRRVESVVRRVAVGGEARAVMHAAWAWEQQHGDGEGFRWQMTPSR